MITFTPRYQLINLFEIREFENKLGLSLPEDYKTHMLQYNGGRPEGHNVFFNTSNDKISLGYFHPIKYGCSTVEKIYELTHDFLPKNHVSIGDTHTGYLNMCLDQNDYGAVYLYHSNKKERKIANSFTEFVNGLVDYGYHK